MYLFRKFDNAWKAKLPKNDKMAGECEITKNDNFCKKYSIARIIWPSLIRTPRLIRMVVQDTTLDHW